MMDAEARLLRLKTLLGIEDGSQDPVLSLTIQTAEEMVLAYLNRDALPPELENIFLLICAAYWKGAALGQAEGSSGPVSSVKRGDVTISFAAAGETGGNTFSLGGGDGFFGWRTALDGFRKVRW